MEVSLDLHDPEGRPVATDRSVIAVAQFAGSIRQLVHRLHAVPAAQKNVLGADFPDFVR